MSAILVARPQPQLPAAPAAGSALLYSQLLRRPSSLPACLFPRLRPLSWTLPPRSLPSLRSGMQPSATVILTVGASATPVSHPGNHSTSRPTAGFHPSAYSFLSVDTFDRSLFFLKYSPPSASRCHPPALSTPHLQSPLPKLSSISLSPSKR